MLLEYLGYFKGASRYFINNSVYENKNKHPVQSEAVMEKLQKELKHEIELYQFIVRRLNLQVSYVK